VAATVGSVVGALVFYWLGSALGEERLRAFVSRYGRWLAMDEDDLDDAMGWFERHGGMAVLIGRLVPSIRSIISIPAGIAKMPLVPFVAYTTVGSALWNAILVGGGWALGAQWERVKPFMNVIEWASIVAVVGGVVWWFARKRRKNETAAAAG
jgi:membrane protein DedA with SNARE-associated domain